MIVLPESFNNENNDKRLLGASLVASAYGAEALFRTRGNATEVFNKLYNMSSKTRGLSFEEKISRWPQVYNEIFRENTIPQKVDFDRHAKSFASIYESSMQVAGSETSIFNTMKRSRMNKSLRSDMVSKYINDPISDIGKSGALVDFVTRANTSWSEKAISTTLPDGSNIYNMDFAKKYLGKYFNEAEMLDIFNSINTFRSEYVDDYKSNIPSTLKNRILDYRNVSQHLDTIKETATGDRRATIGDVLNIFEDNPQALDWDTLFRGEGDSSTLINTMRNRIADNPRYANLEFGGGLRISSDGRIYSQANINKIKRKALDSFGDSLFGSILKVNQIKDTPPTFAHIKAGSHNPVLAAIERGGGKGTSRIKDDYFYIGNKFYRVDPISDALEHVEKLDDYVLKSSKSSFIERSLRITQGDQTSRDITGKIRNKLDLGTSGTRTVYEEFASRFSKYKDPLFSGNVIKSMLEDPIQSSIANEDTIIKEFDKVQRLKGILSSSTPQASIKDIKSFKDSLYSYQVINRDVMGGYLDIALMNDDDMLESISKISMGFNTNETFRNNELNKLISRYKKNSQLAYNQFKTTGAGRIYFPEMVRQEIVRESLHIMKEGSSQEKAFSYIAHSQMTPYQKALFTDLSAMNVFDELVPETRGKDFDFMKRSVLNVKTFLQGSNPEYKTSRNAIIKALDDIASEKRGFLGLGVGDHINRTNINPGYTYGDFIVTKKVLPKDIISNINQGEKLGGFINQFFSSRQNLEDFSTLSALGVNSVDRLTHGLEKFGLGFSEKSTQSAMDIALNIGLKRVAPIALGITALSYLNYESEKVTGTSMDQSLANVRARAGIAIRNEGLVNALNAIRDTIVPLQYLIDEPIRNREEYKEYLDEGYDPVRKGRYWGFGSMSEYRGGKISYYEPNYLRRAYSHARDVSLYGSQDEKWAHSWIPTPRHPFSTIRRLLDPYYLEKKHYHDRPYPLTGKMFAEGTPWGAVLNPTIGRILKPQRRMHVEDMRYGFTDTQDIIAAENERIKLQSSERKGLISFKGDGTFNNVTISNNPQIDISYQEAFEYNQRNTQMLDSITSKSFMDKVLGSTYIGSDSPLDIISRQNEMISIQADGFTDDRIFSVKQKIGTNEYNKSKEILENRNVQTNFDYVNDMYYSMSQLGGIYGFLGGQISNRPKSYALASADAMTGAGDIFWEQGAGGIGGGIMEISRRFFAHEDRSVEKVNYLRNTMPSWMPSKFRYGDPYDSLPKGESRLPGKGYETLNQLHPDKFGIYGAYDRAKILADIAPWSQEYKQWKKIAKSQASGNPIMTARIEAMEHRVKRQSKRHEFFNYRFVGKETKTDTAIVKEVMSGGRFKVAGDSSIYRLAGVDIKENADISPYLFKGQNVQLSVDKNEHARSDQYGIIDASVKVYDGFQYSSISKQLIKNKLADRDREDTSAAASEALYSPVGRMIGSFTETLAHYPVPFFHDKFMKVDSALESFRNERIYGTPYATWDNPIRGFLLPSIRRGMAQSNTQQFIAIGAMMANDYFKKVNASTKFRTLSKASAVLTNRGAMAGAILENLYRGNIGPAKLFDIETAKRLPKLFTGVMMIGSTMAKTKEGLSTAIISGAMTGGYLGHSFGSKGAMIGSAIGATSAAIVNIQDTAFLSTERKEIWVPEETKARRRIDEYFDRLTYKKYKNLYNRASQLAKIREGIDIKSVLEKLEDVTVNRDAHLERLNKRRQRVIQMYSASSKRRQRILKEISEEIKFIQKPESGLVSAGEFTKSAVAYKRAMDSTIYGLKKNATWSQILRAVPKADRDYILEFAKERDPKKRAEIMKNVSPYQRKVLQIAWKEDVIDEPINNTLYFMLHKNVSSMWAGMRSDVDLEKVKIKTIENEGMELADFGYYESQLTEPDMDDIPELPSVFNNIVSLLTRQGFEDVDISITPNYSNETNFLVNVQNGIGNLLDFIKL